MKTVSLYLFIGIWIFSPARAMDELSDSQLESVSCQAGISLSIDDIIIYQSFTVVSCVDTDGGDTTHNPFADPALDGAGPASLNLEDMEIDVLRINALAPSSVIGSNDAHFSLSDSEHITEFAPKLLSIDLVDELPTLSVGYNYMLTAKNSLLPVPNPASETYNKAGIFIDLPTLDIYMDELNIGAVTLRSLDRDALNNGSSFCSIGIEGWDTALLSGIVEVSPHKDCGIDIAADDVLIYLGMDELSFYDPGGISLPGYTGDAAGLVLENVKADLIHINALTHTDFSLLNPVNVHIKSPGQEDAHLDHLDNYRMIVLADVLKSFHGQPLLMDATRHLPDTTKLYQANNGETGCIGGVYVALPTQEIYLDSFSIGRIAVDDPAGTALNNATSFFPMRTEGETFAVLNGAIEISSH